MPSTETTAVNCNYQGIASSIASNVSDWITVVAAGGMDDQDDSGSPQDIGTDLDSDHILFSREQSQGTYVMASFCYAGTPSTDPAVRLFGRVSARSLGSTSAGEWMLLKSRADATDATMTTDTSNDVGVTVGGVSLSRTTSSLSTHTWDCAGCDEFVFAVTTAYAVSAGSDDTALLQAKVF